MRPSLSTQSRSRNRSHIRSWRYAPFQPVDHASGDAHPGVRSRRSALAKVSVAGSCRERRPSHTGTRAGPGGSADAGVPLGGGRRLPSAERQSATWHRDGPHQRKDVLHLQRRRDGFRCTRSPHEHRQVLRRLPVLTQPRLRHGHGTVHMVPVVPPSRCAWLACMAREIDLIALPRKGQQHLPTPAPAAPLLRRGMRQHRPDRVLPVAGRRHGRGLA
jgi:hypothetical protein